jgi:hypothetical protein
VKIMESNRRGYVDVGGGVADADDAPVSEEADA